jgi:hypothetical protein
MRPLVLVFVLLFTTAAALSIAISFLVTASLVIAERGPQGLQFLGISLLVSAVFLLLGLLLIGIELQIVGIARIAQAQDNGVPEGLRNRVFRLLILLALTGLGLGAALAALTYGVIERIKQGFAIFG